MLCNNYSEIYKYYERIANNYKNRGLKILKTDTHNESGIWDISIPLAPILAEGNELTCIEIDEVTLQKAKQRFPDLDMRHGDIRTWEGDYDIIFDFSTIDHVADYREVLKRYRANAADLSCIVWLSDTRPCTTHQYFFPPVQFTKDIVEIYGTIDRTELYHEGSATLAHFLT